MRNRRAMPAAVFALLLASCASPLPEHFYVIDLAAESVPVVDAQFDRAVTVLVDELPAQVDRPELLLRDGSHGADILEGERWAAPLADALRRQLLLGMGRALPAAWIGSSDVGGTPLRVRVRFEALDLDRAGHATLAASWVSRDGDGKPRIGRVSCSRQVTAGDLAGGVAAWSGELAEVATAIARSLSTAS